MDVTHASLLRVTTSRSKPPYDRSALRPEADTLNQTVRSRFTPPERHSFKLAPPRADSNSLNYRDSNIRTKMAVVRLPRRKWAERDEKRPEVGLSGDPGGSDNLPGMAASCGIPTAKQGRKKNVPTGRLGGGRGIRTLGTLARTTVFEFNDPRAALYRILPPHVPSYVDDNKRIFLAYWFGLSILFMILSLVVSGSVSIHDSLD